MAPHIPRGKEQASPPEAGTGGALGAGNGWAAPDHRPLYDVVVVGAGVSGCACAATLACAGARVLAVNSALDVVGLPGYGPDVTVASDDWTRLGSLFQALPPSLRNAWLNAAAIPETGAALLVVDRRAVSIETKRALEALPGLEFRQGLITDLRPGAAGGVEVETAFGEVFSARAVVVATGLSLDGAVEVGDDTVPGGRYGEVPADDLARSLEGLGGTLDDVAAEVGVRFRVDQAAFQAAEGRRDRGSDSQRLVSVRRLLESEADAREADAGKPDGRAPYARAPESERLGAREPDTHGREAGARGPHTREADASEPYGAQSVSPGVGAHADALAAARRALGGSIETCQPGLHGNGTRQDAHPLGDRWPAELPPSPHWDESLRQQRAWGGNSAAGGTGDSGAADTGSPLAAAPPLLPDGVATAEYYRMPPDQEGAPPRSQCDVVGAAFGWAVVSRPAHIVRGRQIGGLTEGGRLLESGLPVWVAGRAAGAQDYVQSLGSGVAVARAVWGELGFESEWRGTGA